MYTQNNESQNVPDLIDYFEICNRSEGKSKKTIDWYSRNLRYFYRYIKSRHLPDSIEQIDIKLLREFILHLLNKNKYEDHPYTPVKKEVLSTSTVHGYVRTLRAFYSWLVREGFIEHNLAKELKPPIVPKKVISTLSDEEIRSIYKTFHHRNPCDMRNQTILLIFLG